MSQILRNSTYELFYWKNCDWESLGEQKRSGTDLLFENVPGDALFRLKQKTEKDEKIKERIFLYKKGEVIWM